MIAVHLAAIDLPEFGRAAVPPQTPAATYRARLAAARERAAAAGLDVLVVHGDRGHSAALDLLTGFAPGDEEALLILTPDPEERPVLLAGSAGWAAAAAAPIELERALCQTFSPLGQPRGDSLPLAAIFRRHGIAAGRRVGVVGTKTFDRRETVSPETWLDAPAYLVDTLRLVTGDTGLVVNATALFTDPGSGLLANNDADRLAALEFAAAQAADALRRLLAGLKPGLTEIETARLAGADLPAAGGTVLVASGPRAALGAARPTARTIARGEPLVAACRVDGVVCRRAGFVAESETGLPAAIRDYIDRLVTPCYAAVVEGYETVGIGVPGGALWQLVERRLGNPFFGIGVNPGYLTGRDGWLESPIRKGGLDLLASGMVLQMALVPAAADGYGISIVEDTIALADETLRAELAERHPEAWARIRTRRAFMREVLGIRIKPEVLPLNNLPGWLPPFLLDRRRAMTVFRVCERGH